MSSGVVASHNNSSGAALTTMEAAERARTGWKWLRNSSASMGTVEKALTDWRWLWNSLPALWTTEVDWN